MKRTITMLLTLVLIAALFTGCGGNEEKKATPTPTPTATPAGTETDPSEPPEEPDLSYPIVTDGSITLEIWYPLSAETSAQTTDLADGTNYAWSELMKRTGINVDFTHPLSTSESEQFLLMVASQEYPDIYKGAVTAYSGGPDKAVEDEVWLRLNELLERFAPNYMEWVNKNDTNRKNTVTDQGNMVCISQVYDRLQPAFAGYAIRQDWLDDLGLARPETYDDWHNVLTQFKNSKTSNNAAPMELDPSGVPISNAFAGGYGVSTSYTIQKDGKIVYSRTEPEAREYLEMMHKWYSEGLIDPEFITSGTGLFPNNTRVANNESGAVALMYTYAGDYLARVGVAEEGANFTLTKWPVKEAGTNPPVAMNGEGAGTMGGGAGGMIFATCEYPEYAIRFIDYLYSEEGMLLSNYGIEGETFEYVDGKPLQTELITKNPDGLTTTMAQERYLIHNGFVVFMLDREEDVQSETALEYRTVWAPTGKWNVVGNLTYTSEEGSELAVIQNDLKTYVDEMTCKFIMGTEELNDTTWNEFVSQVKSMKVDRLIEITQAAYDRYQSR